MEQKIAVVTGGNRGLGLGTVEALAKQGYKVILTARSQQKAGQAAAPLQAKGLDVMGRELDVSSDKSVDEFFHWLHNEFGRIDVLVNNAGAVFEREVSNDWSVGCGEIGANVLAKAFNTNTLGAYRTIRKALPMMQKAGYGRIVNISSGMGGLTEMGGGSPAYRISKTALNAVTRVFHNEAGPAVKINSVCPGWVRTDMGGANATRSIEEGIAGIIWAATLPDGGPSGGFFRDGQPIAW